MDPSAALSVSGVVGFIDHTDIKGMNRWGMLFPEEEVFATKEVRSFITFANNRLQNAVFLSALVAINFSCNICLVPYRIFHLHSCCIELFNRVMEKQQNVMLAFYHFFSLFITWHEHTCNFKMT